MLDIIKEFLDGKGLFYSKIQISDNIRQEEETGFLYCDNAILGHTGIQKYNGRDIGLKGKDAKKVIEMVRDEADVFNKESIASFEGKPITLYHPKDKVNSNNYKQFIVGAINDVKRDGDNLVGNLVIYDEYTIKKILDGELKDLSLGYKAKVIELADGTYKQEEIVINHLAIVEEGRAVKAQIVDGNTVDDELEPQDFTDKIHKTITQTNTVRENTYDDETGEETTKEVSTYESKHTHYDMLKKQLIDSKNNKGDNVMEKDFKYFMAELKDLANYPKSDFRDKAYEALFTDCKETLNVDLPKIEDLKVSVIDKSVGLTDSTKSIESELEDEAPKSLEVFAQDENKFFDNLYRKMDDPQVAKKYASMTYQDVHTAIMNGEVL